MYCIAFCQLLSCQFSVPVWSYPVSSCLQRYIFSCLAPYMSAAILSVLGTCLALSCLFLSVCKGTYSPFSLLYMSAAILSLLTYPLQSSPILSAPFSSAHVFLYPFFSCLILTGLVLSIVYLTSTCLLLSALYLTCN